MKKMILIGLASMQILAASALVTKYGIVKAHTEVFGDSNIEPMTNRIISHLQIDDTIQSIRGSVEVDILSLHSDNKKRDEHMVDALQSKTYPTAIYRFEQITKTAQGYEIKGKLTFHGVTRPMQWKAKIQNNADTVHIFAKSHINMSQYKIKPIKLLFLEVRDRVDLKVDLLLKKQ